MKKILLLMLTVTKLIFSLEITTEDTTSWYKSQLGRTNDNGGTTCIAMLIERSGPKTSVSQVENQLDGKAKIHNNLISITYKYDIESMKLESIFHWNGEGVLFLSVYLDGRTKYIIITSLDENFYIINDPMANYPNKYYNRNIINNAINGHITWIP